MSPAGKPALRIVAPINSPEDVEILHQAGASELYCGLLPQTWVELYGSSDRLNKRQGHIANLTDFEKLFLLQEKAQKLNMPVALTLNTAYTEEMLPAVLEIAGAWASVGGNAIMVSDPAFIMALQKKYPSIKSCLSILANAFNSKVIQFYQRFGISRVVLPRELEIPEMGQITKQYPEMEFEVMVFNDKCHFIDGLCNFYHSTVFNSQVQTAFQYSIHQGKAEVYAVDPGYSGHGCTLLRGYPAARIGARPQKNTGNPGCAACFLEKLSNTGIGYLKLGGRGLPPELNARNIRFIKSIITMLSDGSFDLETIKACYQESYGQHCSPTMCYYA